MHQNLKKTLGQSLADGQLKMVYSSNYEKTPVVKLRKKEFYF
jgi:hypothetical protein